MARLRYSHARIDSIDRGPGGVIEIARQSPSGCDRLVRARKEDNAFPVFVRTISRRIWPSRTLGTLPPSRLPLSSGTVEILTDTVTVTPYWPPAGGDRVGSQVLIVGDVQDKDVVAEKIGGVRQEIFVRAATHCRPYCVSSASFQVIMAKMPRLFQ